MHVGFVQGIIGMNSLSVEIVQGLSVTSNTWPANAADEPFAYLTTIGRTSGKPHRIEIWFAIDHGRVFMMSGGRDRSDWVKNLATHPQVSVEIVGESRTGTATVVPDDSPNDALARNLLVSKYQKKNELASWGKNSLPVVIEFD